MKIISKVEIYTDQETKIKEGEWFIVDYFDDTRDMVWIRKELEPELPAGDTHISISCFTNFFEIIK